MRSEKGTGAQRTAGRRVVFVNRFFYPDQSASSQMLSDLAYGLVERGFRVHVITSRRRFDSSERLPPVELVGGVSVRRVRMSRFKRGGLTGRAADYVTFYAGVAATLRAELERGDIVVCMTDPPLLSLVVAPIVHQRGARLINWVQDLYPDIAEALGLPPRALRPVLRALSNRRNRGFARADANVAIGDRMAEHLDTVVRAPRRTVIIRNWANGKALAQTAGTRAEHRAALGLGEGVVIAHAGNLGRAHDAETLLSAIDWIEHHMPDRRSRPTWLFMGGGAGYRWLQEATRERHLTSVRFAPYVPREQLGDALRAADMHLVSLRGDMEGLLVPSKYYGILAAGRPVVLVGAADGELARAVVRDGCGVVIAPGSSEALARAVLDLAADELGRQALGAAARAAFEARHDVDVAIDAWARLLTGIGASDVTADCHAQTAVT